MRAMTRSLILVLGLLLVLGQGATSAVSASDVTARSGTVDPAWPANVRGDGCAAPVWPNAPAELSSSRVLVIGDSLIRDTRSMLEQSLTAAGWIPTVRCWGGKGSDWGVQQVKRARQLKQLPDHVVVSLGTNDIWWLGVPMEVAVDRMMAAIGPKRTVYWVNLWFGSVGYANYDRLPRPERANRVLRQKAKEYPNLRVVDFARTFKDQAARGKGVGWLDGVHLNQAGNRLRTRLIVSSLTATA